MKKVIGILILSLVLGILVGILVGMYQALPVFDENGTFYCDGTPKECNERYGITLCDLELTGDECPPNCVCFEKGFQCVKREKEGTLEYEECMERQYASSTMNGDKIDETWVREATKFCSGKCVKSVLKGG